MAGEVETMRQFMFAQGSNAAAPPTAILGILERMSALHRQRQSEFLNLQSSYIDWQAHLSG